MISWSSHIYLGKSIKKRKDKIIASIDNGEPVYGIYCIALASNPENLFDIISAHELLYPHYKNSQNHIVGLAGGKMEAYDLVQEMLMEVYKKTGKFDVRTYFT